MLSKLEKYLIVVLSVIAIVMSILVYILYVENMVPECANNKDNVASCTESFTILA